MPLVFAEPYEFEFNFKTCAFVIIDMQRDFLEEGGFGSSLGNDVTLLRKIIPALKHTLAVTREEKMLIVHTREGHAPDLSDLPKSKKDRGRLKIGIGDKGPMGRILIQGEPGHEIIPELAPIAGELVIDKPGKGAFYATDLHVLLHKRGIKQLIICGITAEVCVNTTVREANDRGYDCLVLQDCVASYFSSFYFASLEMTKAQGGIFGWVSDSHSFIKALKADSPTPFLLPKA